ncbi:MAG: tetratricopeptide repeat protein [Acidobacteriota bacterium]|nr:tetratricopeptide repeat protein [Acidobacteriota bacterium]
MMQTARTLRNRLFAAAALAAMLGVMPVRAHAASKEIIQLQTQVQQLLDMVQRLQSTLDTRFAVLQNLAQQTSDQAVQMGATVNALQQKMNAENEAINGKLDTGSGQVQSLNDSVDELKTRIAKLEKSIQDMQSQLQNIQNPPPGSTASPAGAAQPPDAGAAGPTGPAGMPAMAAPAVSQTPPLEQTFQSAMRDYNAAKYKLAASEFQDVIHYYPLDNMAGTAQYYLGEIAYRGKNYDDAVKAYNAVLEGFSGNSKAPAAQLHKGFSLLQMNRREAGIHELRSLIQRYPQTPEAAQARTKLNGMGVRINPR